MKRSTAVSLVLMGAAAAVMAGCDAAPESGVYKDVVQCVEDGFGQEDCRNGFTAALAAHGADVPRFDGMAECEAAADTTCVESPGDEGTGSSTSSFVPFMAGYMMSRAMSGSSAPVSSPVYNSSSAPGQSRDLANIRGLATGATSASVPNVSRAAVSTPTTAVSRGGFGRSGVGSAS